MVDFFEKTLEGIISLNIDVIHANGFPALYNKSKSQFLLPSQKRMDLFTYEVREEKLFFKVIELKRSKANEMAISQALDYCSEVVVSSLGVFKEIEYEVIVIATDFTNGSSNMMDYIPSLRLFIYDYGIDGIIFKELNKTSINGLFLKDWPVYRDSEIFKSRL